MKTLYFLVMGMLYSITSAAANYYFSTSTGDDSRTTLQSQNPLTPWRTLEKLNSFFPNLNPGDSVLFKSGDLFDGGIRIMQSGSLDFPIVLSSYGYGSKPTINGLTALTAWVKSGDGIWKSACSSCGVKANQVLLNGTVQAMGRFPNLDAPDKGYLTLESHNGNNQIIDNELSDKPNWTGADVVIRKNRWIIDRYPIDTHSGNHITYTVQGFSYAPDDRYGYFIQNDLRTLDQFGEWYFDPNQKMMYLYFGKYTPSEYNIDVSVVDTLVTLHNQNNIKFYNLAFTGANKEAFNIYNAQYIDIDNCNFSFSGIDAFHSYKVQHFTLQNSIIQNTNNDAFAGYDCFYSTIRNNRIRNTGLHRGMGSNNDDAYQAVLIRGNNNLIEFNTIDSTGYIPIRFEGDSVTVKNNVINYFALVKDDGGGIYTWKAGDDTSVNYKRTIVGNIILNGEGDGAGTSSPTYHAANGIYVDGHAGNVNIMSNTVAYCSLGGIFFNNPNNNVTKNNTVFDNGTQLFMGHGFESVVKNNLITNNILFSKKVSQFVIGIESSFDDIVDDCRFDSNYYCRPLDDNFVFNNTYKEGQRNFNKVYDLQNWQSVYKHDISSRKSPMQVPYYNVNHTVGGNRCSNGTFDNDINGVYTYSAEDNCKATWSSGMLDGGALQISFSAQSKTTNLGYFNIIPIGAVKAGENYIIKFSLSGSNENKNIGVFLRQLSAPYKNLTDVKYYKISDKRNESEFLLTVNESEDDAILSFVIEEQKNPVYIDNVILQQVDATITDLDNILFEYNSTQYLKKVILDGIYTDIKSNVYTGVVSLSPYTSIILFKQPLYLLPVSFFNLTGVKTEQATLLHWSANNDTASDYFDIERSNNAINFVRIGTVSSQQNAGAAASNYSYRDNFPPAATSYYRIKMIDIGLKKHIYSKTIKINYVETVRMVLSPNPARERIQISINGLSKQSAYVYILVRSASGAIVKVISYKNEIQLYSIDLSSLNAGIYFIDLISNGNVLKRQALLKL